MKTYNLSEIAKEYATRNQCGLPLTPEQLLNSVVVYVNEEVSDVASNSFPFTTEEKESVFNVTKLTYSDNTVTLEYTSDVNGKKFTMKQPFGARENGGLTCDVNESGTAMEVGIDMTGASENYVLTSVGGNPTWSKGSSLYFHNIAISAPEPFTIEFSVQLITGSSLPINNLSKLAKALAKYGFDIAESSAKNLPITTRYSGVTGGTITGFFDEGLEGIAVRFYTTSGITDHTYYVSTGSSGVGGDLNGIYDTVSVI